MTPPPPLYQAYTAAVVAILCLGSPQKNHACHSNAECGNFSPGWKPNGFCGPKDKMCCKCNDGNYCAWVDGQPLPKGQAHRTTGYCGYSHCTDFCSARKKITEHCNHSPGTKPRKEDYRCTATSPRRPSTAECQWQCREWVARQGYPKNHTQQLGTVPIQVGNVTHHSCVCAVPEGISQAGWGDCSQLAGAPKMTLGAVCSEGNAWKVVQADAQDVGMEVVKALLEVLLE